MHGWHGMIDAFTSSGPVHFEGDFFGTDYTERDFAWRDDEPANRQREPQQSEVVTHPDHIELAHMTYHEEEGAGEHEEQGENEEDDGDYDDDNLDVDIEGYWEPSWEEPPLRIAEAGEDHRPFIQKFPGRASAPQTDPVIGCTSNKTYEAALKGSCMLDDENPYAPFASKLDWEVAKWAKLRGPSATAFTELLGIEKIHEKLDLSYKNSLVVKDNSFDFYYRDIIACIRALFGDPDFAPHLVFVPERHYADKDHTTRLYHDMHTGKWWWSTQAALERNPKTAGATIIPVIISSDKTQLTLFRNKSAYPVYITIGNLPKHIRRQGSRHGQILLGYLPASHFDHITSATERRRAVANVFHACMRVIVAPLSKAGIEGVLMTSGDGVTRRCHPIFSNYVGDYPEQVLVTLVLPPRDVEPILEALRSIEEGVDKFIEACADIGIKPVAYPFWQDLPFVNIYRSITPDILHQLYQGLIKHLVKWLTHAYGANEIDARCRRLPLNHNVRNFHKGLSKLQRLSGVEHAQISQIILGLIVDLRLPGGESPVRLVTAVRALLDFLYLARHPIQTDVTLTAIDRAWADFHTYKSGFRSTNFNFPKAHNPGHYSYYIKLYGTTDNYNTETTERLHIDFAKDAYRSTNHKDEFPQMTLWLERREKLWRHTQYIAFRTGVQPMGQRRKPGLARVRIAKTPSARSVSFDDLADHYGAKDIVNAMVQFVAKTNHPGYSARQVERAAVQVHLPTDRVPVYWTMNITNGSPHEFIDAPDDADKVHVRPPRTDSHGRRVEGRFDTALVDIGNSSGNNRSLSQLRVAQVRAIFSLKDGDRQLLFGDSHATVAPQRFAYVEWFSKFPKSPGQHHRLYKVQRSHVRAINAMAGMSSL
ncbi:hypothetical protein BC629DRAFT_1586009 [Irpex lacteus]|nr:hypothetical protein BC629DRAFT_1586009 [Irpex lacteus]